MKLMTLIFAAFGFWSFAPWAAAEDPSTSPTPNGSSNATAADTSTTESPASRGPASTNGSPVKRKPQDIRGLGQLDPVEYDEGRSGEIPINGGRRQPANRLGIMLQGYYDPVSSYLRMQTSTYPAGFGDQTSTGMGGMALMVLYTNNSSFEFGTGIDYVFPINVQGQQAFTGSFAVNNQTLNIFGVRVLQMGYQIHLQNFTITPYGALGVYYGKDVVNLSTYPGLVDTITYSKIVATFTAGVRGDVALDPNGTFCLGVALEGFQPTNLATQLSQSGSGVAGTTSELPGYEPYLQAGMDFLTYTGFRMMGDLKVSF